MHDDQYATLESRVKEPPKTFSSRMKFLGPGFILSASIVGSGELIATTILGAKAGFVAFWVIIVSCLIKVAIQLEFGKTAILHGETPMMSLAGLSGKSKWAVWIVFVLTTLKIVQVGGMLGGSALVLNSLVPGVPVLFWAVLLGVVTAILISRNYYKLIERVSMLMVALFTLFTLASLVAVSFTPFRFSVNDVISGLQFDLPRGTVLVAIAAFGITGVASDEIIAYNYWCLEKGYAAYTGPRENTEAWRRRAEGWIAMMKFDAIFAMIIYTAVTATFYLLGASILHGRTEIPDGHRLIQLLAGIYTETLGKEVRMIYLVGAFFVLFSSVFATLAYWTRLYSDIFGQLNWIDFSGSQTRNKTVAVLAWIFPVMWVIAYFFIELPMFMILSGGVVGSVLLLLVAYAALWFRYRKNHFMTHRLYHDLLLWLSVLSIFSIGVYGIVELLN